MEKRIIKKYSNRRLYDMSTSKNITLEELAELIASGIDVQVIDNESGEDITNITMAQVIVELEKSKKSQSHITEILKELITSGSTAMVDLVQKTISESVSFFSISKEMVVKFVDKMAKEGKVSVEEKEKIVEELWGTLKDSRNALAQKIKEVMLENKENFVTREEIKGIEKKIDSLEEKLSKLLEKLR